MIYQWIVSGLQASPLVLPQQMGAPPLSSGVLAQALAEESFNGCPITLQILDVQNIKSKDGTQPQRSKVTVSDGVYKCTALLASQLKVLVDNGAISKFALLRVTELVGNKKLGPAGGNKKLLIVLQVDNDNPTFPYHQMIGNPQPVPDGADAGMANGAPAGAAPAPAAGGYGAPPPMAGGYGGGPHPAANGGPGGPGMYGGGGGPAAAPAAGGPGHFGGGGGAPMQQPQQQFGGAPGAGGGPGMYGGGGMGAGAGPAYGMGGGGGGPVAHSQQPLSIVPIKGLNPYQSRWTIKARVTQKSDIRRWSNARSEGKLMSFDLVDKDGGEIKATAWNDQVDMFQDIIQVGKVLTISRASLKPRNARFNNTPHEFEIYLERNSQVQACEDDADTAAIPHIMFNFRKLAELETMEAGAIVDVIGVLDSVEPWAIITRKDGSDTKKRSLTIRDDSGRSVEVTFWDRFATSDGGPEPSPGDQLEQAMQAGARPVVALKSVRVGDFNGKNLGSLGSSTVLVNPDRPEAQQLRAWFDQGGSSMQIAPLSERMGGGRREDRRVCLAQIKSEGLGTSGQADWVQLVATVNFLRTDNMTYPGCPKDFNGRTCQKKLQDDGNGGWRCDRCQTSVEFPSYRYILSLSAQDHTGQEWLSGFGEVGEIIMGRPAQDVSNLDMMDAAVLQTMLHERMFLPYTFKLKVHQDVYNDEARMKVTISKIAPLDPVLEGRHLLDLIHKLDAGQPIFTPPTGGPAAAGAAAAAGGGYGGGGGGGAQYGGGGAGGGMVSPYGGGGGGGGGWNQRPQQGGGGGGGWGNTQQGGGGWNGGGGGGGGMMMQQQGGPGGYGAGGGGGGYGGPPQNGGGGWNQQQQQQPGGFGGAPQPPPQQQYNQQPFNAGFL